MKKIKIKNRLASISLFCLAIANAFMSYGQVSDAVRKSFTTPDKVDSKLGSLAFKDGMPDAATTQEHDCCRQEAHRA